MHPKTLTTLLCLGAGLLLAAPRPAEGQILDRLKERVKNAAVDETGRQAEQRVRDAVRCVFDDFECIEAARKEGRDVVLTDPEGEVLTGAEGRPVTVGSTAGPAPAEGPTPGPVPGQTASTFDFEPGERVLFTEDFAGDNLGDFPRRLEFIQGNMQVVEWSGRRFLRADAKNSRFAVPLPSTLPDRFTIEFDMYDAHGSHGVSVSTVEPPNFGWAWTQSFEGHYFNAGHRQGSGVWAGRGQQVATTPDRRPAEGLVPVRIMVDGAHAKMFIGENRVANVPRSEIGRSDRVYFFLEPLQPDRFVYLGSIRIAAGGRDLYGALETDGRVAVRDILFDTGKATIRPESVGVLAEIGRMLQEHPDLSLMLEGHTDDTGDFDFNMRLSGERAAAVKAHLVETFGIEAGRLRTMGLGPTRPVDTNDTPEGRQRNRRVELVKI